MTVKTLIAIDPDAFAALTAEIAAQRAEIRFVRMSPAPEWVTAAEYATMVSVTRRTVLNRVARGEIETRRQGRTLLVRVNPSA